jgi:probable HAF family extracellular repeat protein
MNLALRVATYLLACACECSIAQLYSLTDLGTFGGATSVAYNVNNNAEVVGRADTATETHAFYWSSGTGLVDLGTLGGNFSRAENIDSFGNIVGIARTSGSVLHAFSYSYPSGPMVDQHGSMSQGGSQSIIYTITDGGRMSGFATNSSGNNVAMYYDGGTWIALPTLGGTPTTNILARGVNDSGQVVGASRTASNQTHAFIWDSVNGIQDLGTFGGTTSQANYINSSGIVVGRAQNASTFNRAFRWENGLMTDLGTLGGNTSVANKINASGDIVGTAQDSGGNNRAFLYTGGIMLDLNLYLDSSGVGWTLTEAMGISDNGFIVGHGILGGQMRAFLLTPVPEPSTWFMLIAGIAFLCVVVRGKLGSSSNLGCTGKTRL